MIAIRRQSGRLELLDAPSGGHSSRRTRRRDVRGARLVTGRRTARGPGAERVGTDPHPELVNDDGSTVIDAHGRPVTQLRHRLAVNSGMSWSPDGRSILLYSRDTGRYSIWDVTNGSESLLRYRRARCGPLAGQEVEWCGWPAGPATRASSRPT